MQLILVEDGGGARGVTEAQVMTRLKARIPTLLEHVWLHSGASIGGINSLGFAAGAEPEELVEVFLEHGPKIFGARDWKDSIPGDELFRANFSNDGLRRAMEPILGDKTLGDLDKKVLIPAFDLDNQDEGSKASATQRYTARYWKPKFMHNFSGAGNDCALLAMDAALRTSAAPTYFESYQGYVDGGVVDNNPSMSALAKAVKEGAWVGSNTALMSEVVEALEQVSSGNPAILELLGRAREALSRKAVVLSLGTGYNPHYIAGTKHDYGITQWLKDGRLLNMVFDGMLGVPDYQCKQLLNGCYHRVNSFLDEVIDLADYKKMGQMLEIANAIDLDPIVKWLEGHLEAAA